ncbi:hypothetical protein, partial [Klebsiella pneumoniae]|uniref:hypothetical protein n=1 Tax=Klebsiella pneumoniae TaxID=573 RepID=UPI001F4B7208
SPLTQRGFLFSRLCFSSNGVRGGNVFGGRGAFVAVRGKRVFRTFRNRVRRRPAITLLQVAGRLTTRFTGDSNRELNQESPLAKNTQSDE